MAIIKIKINLIRWPIENSTLYVLCMLIIGNKIVINYGLQYTSMIWVISFVDTKLKMCIWLILYNIIIMNKYLLVKRLMYN